MNKIFYDENKNYKFDFNDTLEIFEPHNLSQKTTMLADVDFVLKSKDKIIFLEYKNATTKNASNPEAFKEKIIKLNFVRIFQRSFLVRFLPCHSQRKTILHLQLCWQFERLKKCFYCFELLKIA